MADSLKLYYALTYAINLPYCLVIIKPERPRRFRFNIHHHHVADLLQTSAIISFQPSLSSVLLVSLLLGDYFSRYVILCVVFFCFRYHRSFHSIFVFFSPSALFLCSKDFSCLFLMVLSRDLLYPAISITLV